MKERTEEILRRLGEVLPGVRDLRTYRRSYLRHDIVAGLVVTALLIPTGIGYAQAAGLPPSAGIYATVVPMLAYALFGPSRIYIVAPDSGLAAIILVTIAPLAGGSVSRAVALAGILAVLVGIILIGGGLLRVGVVVDLLSKPIRIGYLNGIVLIVMISQFPTLVGFQVAAKKTLAAAAEAATHVVEGHIDPVTLAFGLGSLVFILVANRLGSKVPGVLLVVIAAVLTVAATGTADRIVTAGAMPRGFVGPNFTGVSLSDVKALVGPAFVLAVVAFAEASVLSRLFAARRGEEVDPNHEMVGLGASNLAGGLFGGFPISASASRTPVIEHAGAKTRYAAVVGALAVVIFMVAVPDLTALLPKATLSAVVMVAISKVLDVREVVKMARVNRTDFAMSVAATVGVLWLGVMQGIVVTVVLSLLAFALRSWRPYRAELGEIEGLRGYHDVDRHDDARRVPGTVLVRFDAPLFFANAELFRRFVLDRVNERDQRRKKNKRKQRARVHTVVVAAEPITDIDTTAVDELITLDDVLASRGISLTFAEMKDPVRDILIRYGLGERFGPDRFYPTVSSAVDAITGNFRTDIEEHIHE